MLKDPGRLKLGGEERILTVLFSDLEGFTTHSERLAPHEVLSLLSDYYDRMTEQVFAYQGTLKEYVGDELMAFFGAPVEQADHAAEGVRGRAGHAGAARRPASGMGRGGPPGAEGPDRHQLGPHAGRQPGLQVSLQLWRSRRPREPGLPAGGTQPDVRNGDLIGENTARLVEGAFLLREIDTVRVKGRRQVVRVYELLARAGTTLPREQEQALREYAAGLEAYRQRAGTTRWGCSPGPSRSGPTTPLPGRWPSAARLSGPGPPCRIGMGPSSRPWRP